MWAVRVDERIILKKIIDFLHVILSSLVGRTTLHGIMSQKMVICIVTSVRIITLK
jgi:hypothetical protein